MPLIFVKVETGHIHMGVEQLLQDVLVQPWHLLLGMVFFILLIAGVIFFILLYLIRRTRRSALRLQLREIYSELISELAVCETEDELYAFIQQPSVKELLYRLKSDGFARKVMITELLKTVKSMSGSAAANVCWFYAQADLDKDSLTRLQNGAWHVKARAIQELSGLRQRKQITKIYRLTNHPDELVRDEARTAVVKLTGFEGLRFLDVITYPITAWQQLCLLHELSFHKAQSFDQIGGWLNSANSSVVEFALQLIKVYQLYDLHPQVLTCMSHPSVTVRKKAIQALHEIYQAEAAEQLINQFQQEEQELQLLILQLFEVHASETEVAFLVTCLSHTSPEIQAAAAKALHSTHADGIMLIEQQVAVTEYPWTILLPQLKQEGAI